MILGTNWDQELRVWDEHTRQVVVGNRKCSVTYSGHGKQTSVFVLCVAVLCVVVCVFCYTLYFGHYESPASVSDSTKESAES